MDVDEDGAQGGEQGDAVGGVEELFGWGGGGEELAAEVGGVAAGAGYGGAVGAGVGLGFTGEEARVGDPDGGDQEEEGEGEEEFGSGGDLLTSDVLIPE